MRKTDYVDSSLDTAKLTNGPVKRSLDLISLCDIRLEWDSSNFARHIFRELAVQIDAKNLRPNRCQSVTHLPPDALPGSHDHIAAAIQATEFRIARYIRVVGSTHDARRDPLRNTVPGSDPVWWPWLTMVSPLTITA